MWAVKTVYIIKKRTRPTVSLSTKVLGRVADLEREAEYDTLPM